MQIRRQQTDVQHWENRLGLMTSSEALAQIVERKSMLALAPNVFKIRTGAQLSEMSQVRFVSKAQGGETLTEVAPVSERESERHSQAQTFSPKTVTSFFSKVCMTIMTINDLWKSSSFPFFFLIGGEVRNLCHTHTHTHIFFLCFLGANLWHMKVPRLGVRSEL